MATSYQEMIDKIIVLTNRPDLEDETAAALFTATRSAHFSDAYPRDWKTAFVDTFDPAYTAELDIYNTIGFARVRSFSKVRPLADPYEQPTFEVALVEINDVYDDYRQLRNNIAYVAGRNLIIRTAVPVQYYRIDYYQAPLLMGGSYSELYDSWIADNYPDVIVYWAASIVLDTCGNESKAQKYMQAVQGIHLPFLKANFGLTELR